MKNEFESLEVETKVPAAQCQKCGKTLDIRDTLEEVERLSILEMRGELLCDECKNKDEKAE